VTPRRYRDAATAKLNASCNVLPADASGAHYLVQLVRFGWIETGKVFTALPGIPPYAAQVATARDQARLLAGGAVDLLAEEVGVA